ncbi:MAG TPA: methylamine methyltransferase corrinoid protein reductive activase, partial [Methanomassiliicoccaceae archaeon]|nr:methylamine methyltransferase corrinoid protein reductive activase [Methanomassiliicoccaceae archaeon]
TSGIRMHAVDLESKQIISTAITVRHPVPGANVMDHLTFCIEVQQDLAHRLLIDTSNKLMKLLDIDLTKVERVAICGNPIQLSMFQNIETRDLAFVGETALKVRGVELQKRDAAVINAIDLGLELPDKCQLYIPPAIKHEIGADALAMMYKTGLLDRKENVLVTDYGTNAEMALKVGDEIITGSAAAGPAMEGQHIKAGMLASPGAISDVNGRNDWKCTVLDDDIIAKPGDVVDPNTGSVMEEGEMHGRAVGITGTGVIAAIAEGLEAGLIKMPHINTFDKRLHFQDGIVLEEHDVLEAAKAFGAMRAGHFTLLEHAGLLFEDLDIMYMSGASGTYVDALKAQRVGLLPPTCGQIYQFGNTSLAMALDLVRDPELLDELQSLAQSIRANHIMFASDKVFEKVFIQELALWTEGMPIEAYNMMLDMADLQPLPPITKQAKVTRTVMRDIPDLGYKGLKVLRDTGVYIKGSFEGCTGCERCVQECPESAIRIRQGGTHGFELEVASDLCNGTACMRCERACPQKCFKFREMQRTLLKA